VLRKVPSIFLSWRQAFSILRNGVRSSAAAVQRLPLAAILLCTTAIQMVVGWAVVIA